jgi:hypothetical protein
MGIETGTALLISGLLGAGSSVAGALTNKPKTTTSQPTYTPQQQQMQQSIGDSLQQRMAAGVNLDPQKVAAMGGVNQQYGDIQKRMEASLTARGFGQSGKVPLNTQQIEIGRAGAMGGLESQFAQMKLQQENAITDEAQRFAFATPGNSTTTPGNMLGGGISSGLETFASLFALNRFLQGGGFGGGGVSQWGPGGADTPGDSTGGIGMDPSVYGPAVPFGGDYDGSFGG